MADLAAQLPSEIQSDQRFIPAAPVGPSIFQGLAQWGSDAASSGRFAVRALSIRNRYAQEAQREGAMGDAANVSASIFRGFGEPQTDPNTPPSALDIHANPSLATSPQQSAAIGSAVSAGQQAQGIQTSINQGGQSPTMGQARIDALVTSTMARHPGQEAAVAQTFKELGIWSMYTAPYDQAHQAQEDQIAAINKAKSDLMNTAENKYGYRLDKMTPDQIDQTLSIVGNAELAETNLKNANSQADLIGKQQTNTQSQINFNQSQASNMTFNAASQWMSAHFDNVHNMFLNVLTDPSLASDPIRLEKLQGHLASTVVPSMNTQFAAFMASPQAAYLTPDAKAQLRAQFESQINSVQSYLSGPSSLVETQKRIFTDFQNTYGIQFSQFAPHFAMIQKALGPQVAGTLLSGTVTGDPALQAELASEIKNLATKPVGAADVGFSDFVKSISSGQNTMSPDQSKALAPLQMVAMQKLSANPVANNGSDPQAHAALVHSIKNVSAVAVDVNPGWGFNSILNQTRQLTTPGVSRALFGTTVNRQDREDAINQYLPALTRSYNMLSTANSGDPYYSVKLDPHTLKWQPVWNGQMRAADGSSGPPNIQTVRSGMAFMQTKPIPSQAVIQQANALNQSLDQLSAAAKNGWDGSLGTGVSYLDARKYYAMGVPAGAMAKPAAIPTERNGKTPEQNVEEAVREMTDFTNHLPAPGNNVLPAPAKAPATAITTKADMDAYYSGPGKANEADYQKYAPVVAAAAQAHGVPISVAMNLVHTESKFNPEARSDKGAVGLGQIMPETAAAYGKDVNKMSVQENADTAMRILSDNYKRTGNWKDAASMYFSGRALVHAARASDGHTTAPVYASAVVPADIAPDSWLSENMPVGEQTPYGTRY